MRIYQLIKFNKSPHLFFPKLRMMGPPHVQAPCQFALACAFFTIYLAFVQSQEPRPFRSLDNRAASRIQKYGYQRTTSWAQWDEYKRKNGWNKCLPAPDCFPKHHISLAMLSLMVGMAMVVSLFYEPFICLLCT